MVHVELECDTAAYTVYYDTGWIDHNSNYNNIWLEPIYYRPGGPYTGGQWCRYSHVAETIIDQDQYWTTILSENPHRGEMWT